MLSRPRSTMNNTLGSRGVPQAFQLNTMAPASMQSPLEPKTSAIMPKMTFAQSGRGSFNAIQTKPEFVPANQKRPVKQQKMANGMTKIIEVKPKENKEDKESDGFDTSTGKIDWDVLEKDRKRKPCVRALKSLAKKMK